MLDKKIVAFKGETIAPEELIRMEQTERVKLAGKMVKEGTVVPLNPMLKADDTPSKIGGEEMRSVEDSQVQRLYGIGAPVGSDEAKAFELNLQGKACSTSFPLGKPLTIRAVQRKSDNDRIYILSSNQGDFQDSENQDLIKATNNLGAIGMIQEFFKGYIVDRGELLKWEAANKIPEQYASLFVVKEVSVLRMNLATNEYGNISIAVDLGTEDEIKQALEILDRLPNDTSLLAAIANYIKERQA